MNEDQADENEEAVVESLDYARKMIKEARHACLKALVTSYILLFAAAPVLYLYADNKYLDMAMIFLVSATASRVLKLFRILNAKDD